MKALIKITFLGLFCILVLTFDVASLGVVADAEAQYGTRNRMRRRTARRTAVAVSSADSAKVQQANQEAAAANQRAAEAEQEAEAAKAEAEAAKQQASAAQAVPAPATGPLPVGTVVTALPDGCNATTSDGVEYYHCGDNYYRAAFQGNQLVYVTTDPP